MITNNKMVFSSRIQKKMIEKKNWPYFLCCRKYLLFLLKKKDLPTFFRHFIHLF